MGEVRVQGVVQAALVGQTETLLSREHVQQHTTPAVNKVYCCVPCGAVLALMKCLV